MARTVKSRLALLVALAAVLAGGAAVALGATGSSRSGSAHHARLHAHRGAGLLAAASHYLEVAPAEIRNELREGRTLAQIASATPGHSEAGLVEALVSAARAHLHTRSERLPAKIKSLVDSPHAGAGARGGWLRGAVINYLGLTRRQLSQQLRAGRTLAQVAEATPGRSKSGLIEAIVAAGTTHLKTALAAGSISSSTEAMRAAALKARVTVLVERAHRHAVRHPPAG